ncbi:MAG: glutathione S-transferase family protein [Candidatus Binataceae bacterium]
MAEIKLYQFGPVTDRESASPFCVKVHYALRYKHVPFEVVNMANPLEVKKLNPRAKLPVLGCNGTIVSDSTDIVRFVEEYHPEPRLYPQDERERAYALMIEDWADESLYWHIVYENWLVDDQYDKFAAEIFAPTPAPLRPLVKAFARRQSRGQLNGQGYGRLTVDEHRKRLWDSLDWLNSMVGDAFLCGQDLSVADISVAAQVTCLLSPFTPHTAVEIKKRGALLAWHDRTKAAVA